MFRRRWVGQLVCWLAQRMSAGDTLEDAVKPGEHGTRVCRLGGWLGLGCLGLVGVALPGLGQFGWGSPGRVGLDWLWVGLAQLGLT